MSNAEQSKAIDIDVGQVSSELPVLEITALPEGVEAGVEAQLSKEDEDAILINTSGAFADWVAAFLRRVILLFENLPEEGADGSAGGATEGL